MTHGDIRRCNLILGACRVKPPVCRSRRLTAPSIEEAWYPIDDEIFSGTSTLSIVSGNYMIYEDCIVAGSPSNVDSYKL